ncbi:Uncharacterized mitochondrial protein AtMg00310 [Linum perenne]
MGCFKLSKNVINKLTQVLSNFLRGQTDDVKKYHWMSWERMCLPKEEGGLRFKDFEAFNNALLARHAWRILEDPDSLFARVLKGRYFPKNSFMEASLGSKPSWGWRSILHGRELLRLGIIWQVGSGSLINPFIDPWVANLPNQRPTILMINPISIIPGTVANLITQGSWVIDLLKSIFDNNTVYHIISIPLPSEEMDDKLIWKFAPSGAYTVHSGYEVASGKFSINKVFGPTSMWDEQFWKNVWTLPVQPKLKIFLWKIIRGILPTRANLAKKITLVNECPVCLVEEESSEHLFMKCILACKLAQCLQIQTHVFEHDCLVYSWRKIFKLNQKIQVRVLLLWWRLWKSRNDVVFNKKQWRPEILIEQFQAQLREHDNFMEHARMQSNSQRPIVSHQNMVHTSHLPFNFKIKVDGAIKKEIGGAIGFVIFDSLGTIHFAAGKSFQGICDPFTIECLAVREAVCWCLHNRILEFQLEGDAESVHKKIMDKRVLHPIACAIIQEIRKIINKFTSFNFIAIPRDQNKSAHLVAKFALTFLPKSSSLMNLSLFASIHSH